jgi:hypothetical protein
VTGASLSSITIAFSQQWRCQKDIALK